MVELTEPPKNTAPVVSITCTMGTQHMTEHGWLQKYLAIAGAWQELN
jgi:hypothetical protein